MRTWILVVAIIFFCSCKDSNDNKELDSYEWKGNWEFLHLPGIHAFMLGFVDFQLENHYYMGLGAIMYDEENPQKTFGKFVPGEGWTTIAPFPGQDREEAVAFTLEGKAYVGLGWQPFHPGSIMPKYMNDFWVYDPASNSWDSLTMQFPGKGLRGAVAFSYGRKAYVGTGCNEPDRTFNGYQSEFFEFSPETGWKEISTLSLNPRKNALVFEANGEIYVGLGDNETETYRDLYKFSPSELRWLPQTPLLPEYAPNIKGLQNVFVLENNARHYAFVYGKDWCKAFCVEENIWYDVPGFIDGYMQENNVCFSLGNKLFMLTQSGDTYLWKTNY